MKPGQVVDVKFALVSDSFAVSNGLGMLTEDVLDAVSWVADGIVLELILVALNTGTCEATVVSVNDADDIVVMTDSSVVKPVGKLPSPVLLMLLSFPPSS